MPKTNIERINDQVNIREIYALIDSTKKEIMQPVLRIEQKVDNLAEVRIVTLENRVSNIEGRVMMIPTIIGIAFTAFNIVISSILKK